MVAGAYAAGPAADSLTAPAPGAARDHQLGVATGVASRQSVRVDYGFARVYVSLATDSCKAIVPEVKGPPVWVEVRPNQNRPSSEDDFISWPTCVEIGQDDDATRDLGIVRATSEVVAIIEGSGGRAVVSADFRDW